MTPLPSTSHDAEEVFELLGRARVVCSVELDSRVERLTSRSMCLMAQRVEVVVVIEAFLTFNLLPNLSPMAFVVGARFGCNRLKFRQGCLPLPFPLVMLQLLRHVGCRGSARRA
jgi:hypothetical protein